MTLEVSRIRPYRLSEAIDRLFEQSFMPFFGDGYRDSTGWQSLSANVWETNDAYIAAFLMPGADEQTINATVHEDTLVVEGELHVQAPEGARAVWQEFGPAKFRRSLRLAAPIDASKVEALYKNGLLVVTLPKAEHARPRQIKIRVGERSRA